MSTTTTEIAQKLEQAERTTGSSGAVPLQPKHLMLNATDVQEKLPEHRVRWLNLKNPEKIATRMMDGYTRISSEEGGRHLGDEMALFKIPRKKYEERVSRQQSLSKERLSQHNTDMERFAENMSKILRDKYSLNISTEQLLARGE